METTPTSASTSEPIERRIETLDRLLDRQLAWVAAANDRIATPLSLSTAMLGVIAALAPIKTADWTPLQGLLAAFATLGLLSCLACCALAIFPRIVAPHDSLVYFGGISGRDRAAFVAQVSCRTPSDHAQDLLQQIHVNASIAQAKFRWVRRAILVLILSVPAWLGALCLLYQGR